MPQQTVQVVLKRFHFFRLIPTFESTHDVIRRVQLSFFAAFDPLTISAPTVFTQFCPPIPLGIFWRAAGSSFQIPSAKNRYSCSPGLNETVKYHTPLVPLYMGMSSGFQLLKSPASDTFRAFGASKQKGIEI